VVALGCSKLVPRDADRFARSFIDTLRTQPPEVAAKFLDPGLAALPSIADSLTAVQRLLPPGAPSDFEILGTSVFRGSGSTTRQIRYRMRAGGQRAQILITLVEHGAHRRVLGLRVWPELENRSPVGH
jgi:hypothetical protein